MFSCSISFYAQSGLTPAAVIEVKGKRIRYVCNICSKSFGRWYKWHYDNEDMHAYLMLHLIMFLTKLFLTLSLTHSLSLDLSLSCGAWKLDASREDKLTAHLRVHSESKRFACTQCYKRYVIIAIFISIDDPIVYIVSQALSLATPQSSPRP